MIKGISSILFIVLMVAVSACTDKKALEHDREKAEPSGERIIRITFDLKGDDIGSPEYQGVLHKITSSIREKEAGEILSSGFGMGTMDIVIRIKGEESVQEIEKIIRNNYPHASYKIEQRSRQRGAYPLF